VEAGLHPWCQLLHESSVLSLLHCSVYAHLLRRYQYPPIKQEERSNIPPPLWGGLESTLAKEIRSLSNVDVKGESDLDKLKTHIMMSLVLTSLFYLLSARLAE
jgi:hypothetical protein